MLYLARFVFRKNNLMKALEIDEHKFTSFVSTVALGYLDNPYHNKIHAFDVTQVITINTDCALLH